MSIIRWNPARELLNMEREFNKLLNDFGKRIGFSESDSKDEYENAVWIRINKNVFRRIFQNLICKFL